MIGLLHFCPALGELIQFITKESKLVKNVPRIRVHYFVFFGFVES